MSVFFRRFVKPLQTNTPSQTLEHTHMQRKQQSHLGLRAFVQRLSGSTACTPHLLDAVTMTAVTLSLEKYVGSAGGSCKSPLYASCFHECDGYFLKSSTPDSENLDFISNVSSW